MMCFRGNREEFYGEVLLLDGRKMMLTSEQGIKKSSKAAAVLQQVFSHLNLVEVDFFGLRFCDDRQRTHWLDSSRTLSQHRELAGPPYIFYFGVKFYAEDPWKLQETTRCQFYLQVRQDVHRGVLPCPAHLRARLSALMLLAEQGDHGDNQTPDSDHKQEVQLIINTLSGVSRPEVQRLFLSLCSSLQMYGVSLFAAYGENQTEYFLGPTPEGVVVFKNKELVGKYLWQRISKLNFKDETFQLQVCSRNGSETSFFFQMLDRCDCKRLWRCCVEHHAFFRMSDLNPLTHKLKHSSLTPSSSFTRLRSRAVNKTVTSSAVTSSADVCVRGPQLANQRVSSASEPVIEQTAKPAVQSRSKGGAQVDHVKPSAPWEKGGSVSGLFNPTFHPNTREEEAAGLHRRSRSLDGDRPIRGQRRRSRSRGNTSSGSESERTASNGERRRTKSRSRHGNHGSESSSRHRTRSRSPDAQIWKHIQKRMVEPDGVIDRQTEEIPYKEVRVSGESSRTRHHQRGRQHQWWASASDLQSRMVPPLPVTMAADVSCPLPTSP